MLRVNYHKINEELLIKFLAEETTVEESTTIQQRITSKKRNEKYFSYLKSIWEESYTGKFFNQIINNII